MNTIREIQALNKRELENGVSTEASWHADYRDTAYIYIGGLPFDLSEGDIITIFSQFGEPVHVHLVRDKDTGKSKGFAFLKYEDQRSTDLAVDNLGGANVMGRILKVDHTRYKQKDTDEIVDNAINFGNSGGDGDSDQAPAGRRRKRRLSGDIGGAKDGKSAVAMDKEPDILIEDYDEDDPMKEYLARQKEEDIQNGLGKQRKEKSRTGEGGESRRPHRHHHRRHRRDSETDGNRHVGQEEHRHRPKSRDRSEDASRENFRRRRHEQNQIDLPRDVEENEWNPIPG